MNLMKKTKFLIPLVAIAAVLSFIACDNEALEGQFSDTPPTDIPEIEENFQVSLDSLLYVGQTVHAITENGELSIKAYQGKGNMELRVFAADTGSFKLESQEAIVTYMPDRSVDTLFYVSKSGTVKITSLDSSMVTGTFSGKLENAQQTDSIPMANGIFDNIVLTSSGSGPEINTATAMVDGEEFTAISFPFEVVNNQIKLTFINDSNDQIQLILPEDVIASTNSITSFPSDFSAVYTDFTTSGEMKYYSVFGSGEITVESYANGIIVGTFYFDAKTTSGDESANITQGTFIINMN